MKKKLLSILFSVALIAAMLVGCGGSSSAPTVSESTEKSTEADDSTESTFIVV